MIDVYRSTGERVAYIIDLTLYSLDGVSLGYLEESEDNRKRVFLNNGNYLGELIFRGGRYMILRKEGEIDVVRNAKKISTKVLAPLKKIETTNMPRVLLPVGWRDAL